MWRVFTLGAGLLGAAALCLGQEQPLPPPLTFYASFDNTLEAQARGEGRPVKVEGQPQYRPGRVGQALLCGEGGTLVYYASADNLRAAAGTIELWVCPLDWTGREEEFHVFCEALDPGWLVFYRYYQGGILTLLGVDSQHYTAAASPPIDWQPGQWHHLAGTWRARRLEVYIDGQRVGVADAALLPERFGPTFRLGDHPWHVPRQRQTLLDEVKIYAAPLDPESIAAAARLQPFQWKPQLVMDMRIDPEREVMRVQLDATGLVGEWGRGRSARVELLPRGKAEPVGTGEIGTFVRDMGTTELALAGAVPGEYVLRARLLDEQGQLVAETESPLHKPGPPVWRGNRLGISNKVLPPWTPLRLAGPTAVECWGRRYQFGLGLTSVQSQGQSLLSAPVTLEAIVSGKPITLAGGIRIAQRSEPKITFTGTAAGGGLRLGVRHEIEFDGFTWTELELEAPQPAPVEELWLRWRMPRKQATLLHLDAMRWSENFSGALPATGFTSSFVPYFWLGNEDCGLSWYAESTENWILNPDRPAIEIRPQGEEVQVIVRLIATPTTLQGQRRYGYGMMATPVRPYPPDALRWRMTPGVNATFDIVWPNGNMRWYGHPEPEDPEKFAARVREGHQRGLKTVPYVNLNFISAGVPEWAYYGSLWADPDRVVTPSDVAAMGYASMGVCPASRDWQEFILYRINEAIERYQIDGIYIDCWGPAGCRIPPCGYVDAQGKRQRTHPIRAYREIIRRVYTLFYEKRPDPLLMVHMSSEVVMPMLSFTHTILDGEQFSPTKIGDDYLNVLPPDKFRAEFLGRNMGPVEFFLPEFRGEAAARGTPRLAAYLMLHGVQPWPIWSDVQTWNKLFTALDAFDIGRAEFVPYWRQPVPTERPTQLVSLYRSRDGKGVWLVAMNVGETESQLAVTIAPEWHQGKPLTEALEVMTEEKLPLTGNRLLILLPAHHGRLIWLKP